MGVDRREEMGMKPQTGVCLFLKDKTIMVGAPRWSLLLLANLQRWLLKHPRWAVLALKLRILQLR